MKFGDLKYIYIYRVSNGCAMLPFFLDVGQQTLFFDILLHKNLL